MVVFAADGELDAYENPGFEFDATDDETFKADGTVWDPTTGESDDGRTLSRLSTYLTYAYAWQTDHGPTSFYVDEMLEADATARPVARERPSPVAALRG